MPPDSELSKSMQVDFDAIDLIPFAVQTRLRAHLSAAVLMQRFRCGTGRALIIDHDPNYRAPTGVYTLDRADPPSDAPPPAP